MTLTPHRTGSVGTPNTPNPPWAYAISEEVQRLRNANSTPGVDDINRAAGLAWSVYQTPAYFLPGEPAALALDSDGYVSAPQPGRAFKLAGTTKRARSLAPAFILNIRSDVHQVVGIVKERYRLVQNQDIPRLLDQVIQAGQADWATAGLLRGGAEVWWLVRLRETSTLEAETCEKIEFFFLLVHSHDGSKRRNAALLPLRASSQTTLAWSLEQTARTLDVKPPRASPDGITDAEHLHKLADAYRQEFERVATQMLRTPLPEQEFAALLKLVLPTPTPIIRNGRITNQRGITMAEDAKGTITQIYFHNPTISRIRGTLWGAVQAVQYYSDHHTINRNTDETSAAENHFKRITSATTLGSRFFLHARQLAAKR